MLNLKLPMPKRKSIISRVLRIILILLGFLIVISIVNNYYLVKLLNNEFIDSREKEFDNILKSINDRDESIQNLIYQISNDKKVLSIKSMPSFNLSIDSLFELSNMASQLESLKIASRDITDIVVYFNKYDFAVGSNGIYSDEIFLKKALTNKEQKLLELVRGFPDSSGIHRLEGKYMTDMFYVGAEKVNFYVFKNSGISIFVIINKEYSNFMAKRMISSEDTILFVLDADGNIYACNKPELIGSKDESAIRSAVTQGQKKINIGSKRYLLSGREKERGDFTFIVLQKTDALSAKIYQVNIYTLILVFVFFIFADALFFTMNRQLYLPVKKILKKLNADYKRENKSEYDVLDNLISDMYDNICSMQNYIKEQEEFLRESFLNRFISGIDEKMFLGEMHQENAYFVLTCVIEDALGHRYIDEIEHLEKELRSFFNYKKVFVYSKETTYLIYTNCLEYKQTLRDIFTSMHNREIFCIAGVSTPYTDTKQIRTAYDESRTALNYTYVNLSEGTYDVSFFQNNSLEYNQQMDICINDIEQVINTILADSAEGVKSSINSIIHKNQGKPFIIQKELYSYLMNMFYVGVNSRNLKVDEILTVSYNQYMSKFKDIYSIRLLNSMVIESYSKLAFKLTEEKDELIDEIVDYIQKNYNKPISLQLVADDLDMSATYISQYFKKTMGKNFIDYIQDIRIEKAKEILRIENITINEVAVRTGFETVNTFIRTFKKLSGITPGEYKNTIR